jgi:UDP-N-acetylmuramoyl-L-alanyl-D-glutamate--2,6-diaminopimelate ligase
MRRRLSEFWTEELGKRVGFLGKTGEGDPLVTGLAYDSRLVQEGDVFFALSGLHTDGHQYIAQAVERGASVIVHQAECARNEPDVVFIRVKDSRFAMSAISDAFYDHPSKKLCVIGVTGTEGKSTVVYLIFQLLRLAGKKAGFISTVQFSVNGAEHWNPEHQTTPEALTINKQLAAMSENGIEYAVLESSSHGLSPKTNRLGNIEFDVGVMTNVEHEHLEFHGTWEQYRDDKANLFRALDVFTNIFTNSFVDAGVAGDIINSADEHHTMIPPKNNNKKFGVVNADDASAEYFTRVTKKKVFSFSTKGAAADLCVTHITSKEDGNCYEVSNHMTKEKYIIHDKLPGAFNAGNVLSALLVASGLLAVAIPQLLDYVPQLRPVRGRMTAIRRGQSFEVLVDYAHTPSSFKAIFPPLRKRLDEKSGRIISLFGSAGERDTQKRSLMGGIAAKWSDIIILSDEDPRGEEPMAILEEISEGISDKKRGDTLFLIPDRPAAIRHAFSLAQAGDLVLLLGKGHENSIIYSYGGKTTIPYDELAEAEKALEELLQARATVGHHC